MSVFSFPLLSCVAPLLLHLSVCCSMMSLHLSAKSCGCKPALPPSFPPLAVRPATRRISAIWGSVAIFMATPTHCVHSSCLQAGFANSQAKVVEPTRRKRIRGEKLTDSPRSSRARFHPLSPLESSPLLQLFHGSCGARLPVQALGRRMAQAAELRGIPRTEARRH